MDYEKFYGKLRKQNESLIITIPKDLTEANGWQEGITMKVIIRKHNTTEEQKKEE